MKFKGSIIITDPCYIIRKKSQITKDDWEACGYGYDMNVFGINTYLTNSTLYGDWASTTYDADDGELGEFCADAGLVSVFLLDEVLKYNPNFDYHLNKPWTTTLIKDFDGDIEIEVKNNNVSVVGKGNINFYTKQTGF